MEHEIFNIIEKSLKEYSVEYEVLGRDTELRCELGLDSIDIINIATDLEYEYNILFDNQRMFKWVTVGDIIDDTIELYQRARDNENC